MHKIGVSDTVSLCMILSECVIVDVCVPGCIFFFYIQESI